MGNHRSQHTVIIIQILGRVAQDHVGEFPAIGINFFKLSQTSAPSSCPIAIIEPDKGIPQSDTYNGKGWESAIKDMAGALGDGETDLSVY